MRYLLPILGLAAALPYTVSVAQNATEIAPVARLSDAECAKNPYQPGCDEITITPGAVGPGLKPGASSPGLIPKGIRPMDKPSFDRDNLRLPRL